MGVDGNRHYSETTSAAQNGSQDPQCETGRSGEPQLYFAPEFAGDQSSTLASVVLR